MNIYMTEHMLGCLGVSKNDIEYLKESNYIDLPLKDFIYKSIEDYKFAESLFHVMKFLDAEDCMEISTHSIGKVIELYNDMDIKINTTYNLLLKCIESKRNLITYQDLVFTMHIVGKYAGTNTRYNLHKSLYIDYDASVLFNIANACYHACNLPKMVYEKPHSEFYLRCISSRTWIIILHVIHRHEDIMWQISDEIINIINREVCKR